jgi:hypothetical protein
MTKRAGPTDLGMTGPSDWADEFANTYGQVKAALEARDRIEEMFAEDLADSGLQSTKLRRAASQFVATRLLEALDACLAGHQPAMRETARLALVERWSRGDPEAKAAVAAILQAGGLTEFSVEAEAVLHALPTLLELERLQASKITRRDRALAGLAFYRRMQTQGQRPAQPDKDVVASEVLRLREPPSDDH